MWKVLVKEGDSVKAGDTLFILEVMKTEVPHDAESDGVIKTLHIKEGRRRPTWANSRWRSSRPRTSDAAGRGWAMRVLVLGAGSSAPRPPTS